MKELKNKKIKKSQRGFSLIEMIVAVAVFAQVMLIATGALLSMINANKKAEELQTVMGNLNFAVDTMSRSMRTGSGYDCRNSGSVNCPTEGRDSIYFIKDGQTVHYWVSNGQIFRSKDGGAASAITAPPPALQVTTLSFYVSGADPDDDRQPKILMIVRGTANVGSRSQTNFNIETLISQRSLDR
jgi:prepilin-type N-terminal cleavage/methylation domain-containing protein